MGGSDHVMDNLLNSDRDVVVGNGDRIHDGWVHSHSTGPGSRRCGDTVDQWPSSRLRRQQIARALGFSRRPQVI